MIRQHIMPFGCEILSDGSVAFRLWAPGLPNVSLRLFQGGQQSNWPMRVAADGWHKLILANACTNDLYQFVLPDGLAVPDPASRFNPQDVHGPSMIVDPTAFDWPDNDWMGRPWDEAVLYELHVGTFSPTGTFAGVEEQLDYLVDLGITAIDIMPVADFPGLRNWGYDGVLPFAPDARYGTPDDFKRLVAAAHARGLMVILDVVYNHFGPEGNYLHAYAPEFFNPRHQTPWGAAINFDGASCRIVRNFFIHNALYWLEEYHLDGLRLDAIHAICDDSPIHIVEELCQVVHSGPGQQRQIHLILENDRNQSRYLSRDRHRHVRLATAQWNDDIHHALHVITTGEMDGYYADYAEAPLEQLGRCLSEGFAFQGDPSRFREGVLRGEPSRHLPPAAFINFLQTHDQIGNRAMGERLCHLAKPEAIEAVAAIILLAPQPPMLFMGEEFFAPQPFLFFCDFSPELAQSVTEGRRREFAHFAEFSDPEAQARIPDPNDEDTFARCILHWQEPLQPAQQHMLMHYRHLLALRRQLIVPMLPRIKHGKACFSRPSPAILQVQWPLQGGKLTLLANLSEAAAQLPESNGFGQCLYSTVPHDGTFSMQGSLPAWSTAWYLMEA